MSTASKNNAIDRMTTLKPSETAAAFETMIKTNRAMFIWGPPGIAKSAVSQQIATQNNMAFIDIRLSQMDPTDLRGIPYPVSEGGVQGVRWSTPMVLPRDLDFDEFVQIEYPDAVNIAFNNPKSVTNKIHYCTNPEINVKSITKGAVAKIVSRDFDEFSVALFKTDDNGVATDEMTTGTVRWSVRGKVRGILGLEEFNSAPPSVQAAAYQLVLDRALGEYVVPDGVYICAMGNRDTDKGVTFKMPTPIMNRFVHVEMRSDFDDWQTWALKSFVHADVVGYLTAFKQDLFQFDAGTAARGFATPRSWHMVSDILKESANTPDMAAMALIFGAVGDGIGIKFWEFRKIAADLPKADEILSGRLKVMPKKVEVALAYALATTLCYELKERADTIARNKTNGKAGGSDRDEWLAQADNFVEFLITNFQPEIAIMGTQASIRVHRLPFDLQKMKTFEKFAKQYKNLIMGN